jgi:hypothetical protein
MDEIKRDLFLVTTPQGTHLTVSDTVENAILKVAKFLGVEGTEFAARKLGEIVPIE